MLKEQKMQKVEPRLDSDGEKKRKIALHCHSRVLFYAG
jgi:hypothetical protein